MVAGQGEGAGVVVPVPEHLLVELERLALRGLLVEARTNGVTPRAGVARLFAAVETARASAREAVAAPASVDLVSAAEAAAALGITKRAVLLRIAAGALPGRRVGGRWLIRRDALPDREAA